MTGIIEAVVAEEDEDDFNLENFFPGPPAPPPSMPGTNTFLLKMSYNKKKQNNLDNKIIAILDIKRHQIINIEIALVTRNQVSSARVTKNLLFLPPSQLKQINL